MKIRNTTSSNRFVGGSRLIFFTGIHTNKFTKLLPAYQKCLIIPTHLEYFPKIIYESSNDKIVIDLH